MTDLATKARRSVVALAIEIDRDELTCRIAEAAMGAQRPAGKTASAALREMGAQHMPTLVGFYRAADAAVAYFHQTINTAKAPH